MGDMAILCTVVHNKKIENKSFLPLNVNHHEKSYSAGKIPGGFFKRDTGKTEKEIIISRLIDRSIRPLFDKHFNSEIQITSNVLSFDKNKNTDVLALIGISASLSIS